MSNSGLTVFTKLRQFIIFYYYFIIIIIIIIVIIILRGKKLWKSNFLLV